MQEDKHFHDSFLIKGSMHPLSIPHTASAGQIRTTRARGSNRESRVIVCVPLDARFLSCPVREALVQIVRSEKFPRFCSPCLLSFPINTVEALRRRDRKGRGHSQSNPPQSIKRNRRLSTVCPLADMFPLSVCSAMFIADRPPSPVFFPRLMLFVSIDTSYLK